MKWRTRAACRGVPQDVFFPENPKQMSEARAICAACPVRTDCLRYALSLPVTDDRTGIFAGTSARQRERFRRFGADLLEWDETKRTFRPLVWNAQHGRWQSASKENVA